MSWQPLSVLRGVEDDGGLSFSSGDTLLYCDYRETGAAIEDACCRKATVAALNPTTKLGAGEAKEQAIKINF